MAEILNSPSHSWLNLLLYNYIIGLSCDSKNVLVCSNGRVNKRASVATAINQTHVFSTINGSKRSSESRLVLDRTIVNRFPNESDIMYVPVHNPHLTPA